MASYNRDNSDNAIRILKAEFSENNDYVEYVIEVGLGCYQWLVRHRYSEFHELNEQLVSKHGLDKKLLPPKKTFGNTSESFIQKRRVALERYLDSLLRKFDRLPYELATFLEFQTYEINGVTQILAQTLFSRGDALLERSSTCLMDPLQLYAITNRMTKPESVVSSQQRDIGHILDFVTRLSSLKIIGKDKLIGTSNINMNHLEYNLAIFKAITYLELKNCDLTRMNGLDHVRSKVKKLKIERSATSIEEFLTRSALHWDAEGDGGDALNEGLIWPQLTSVDLSENDLKKLPEALKYLVKVEYVDLHDNYITEIRHLESSSYLTHIDLSLNKISAISDLHLRLGNIKSINLSGNYLETLVGFNKLYSLEHLDVSNNQISQVLELNYIGALPLLEQLIIQGNSVTVIPDYRIQVFKIFEGRAKELSLDNKKATEQELSTVAVLIALDRAKRPSSNALQQQLDEAAGTSAQGATLAAESRPTDLNINGAKDLDPSALTDKLEQLDQRSELTTSSGAALNTRFDSPFNSPTRSSLESEQHFHSLGSTPKDSAPTSETSQLPAAPSLTPQDSSQQVEESNQTSVSPATDQMDTEPAVSKGGPSEHNDNMSQVSDSTSEISSYPSASFSINSNAADGDDEDDDESSVVVDTAKEESSSKSCEDLTEVAQQVTNLQVDSNTQVTCSSSPVNVSIDVVDHLEQCLANIPKTVQLDGTLQRLTQMDGDELLNLFYHGSVITHAGDSKEELCHAMWTSLVKYDTTDPEEPCLVLLSNQATYFITANTEDDQYNVKSIRHENLAEVCVGPYHQSVRLGGLTSSDYYCCITRDPNLVHIFTTRITFIVDTDFAKTSHTPVAANAESEEEVSIYDTPEDVAERADHPSGVRFIYDEEMSLESIRNFIAGCSESGESDTKLISADFIHTKADSRLLPLTLCLTETTLYLVKESYADHPTPKCCHEDLARQLYVLDRAISLGDVSNVSLQEQGLTLDVMIKESETLCMVFCSLAMAQAFLKKCSQLITS